MDIDHEKAPVPSYWRTIAFTLFVIAISGAFFYIGNQVFTNTTAIEKGCILLNNKITEGQAQQADPNSQTSVLVGTILRVMNEEEYRRFQKADPMTLKNINCHEIAEHPDGIHAVPTVTLTTPRRDDGARTTP